MTSSENFTMPVAPMGYGGGMGGFGGDGAWWLLVLLFALGGWGNGGFGGYGNGGGFVGADVQRGFDQSAVMNGITGLNAAVTSGFSNAEVAACNRALTDLQAGYSNTQAIVGQLTAMQMAQQTCCCENRAGIADLKYTIATENCADRYEAAQNTRDIIETANRNNQAILDKLCALELDAKNEKIADLERQLTMASLAASQNSQTATIQAGQRALATEIENTLNPVPIPAYIVQSPCTAACNNGCGCM